MNNKIIVFFHIEKCGGTSLVEFFRRNLPFQACEAVSKTNAFTEAELRKTLRLYPSIKALSGHNLQVEVIDWLEERGFDVVSFTILRDPLERAISDFLHDYRKSTFVGSLIDYANIAWKQNYLAKFLGSGDPDKALQNLGRIGSVVEIGKSGDFVDRLLRDNGLDPQLPYAIENKASSQLPDEVKREGGVQVGRYSIAPEAHARLLEVNGLDLEIWRCAQARWDQLPNEGTKPSLQPHSSSDGWRKLAASLQRNLAYKPLMGIWSKYYALPRNRSNPATVTEESAFR